MFLSFAHRPKFALVRKVVSSIMTFAFLTSLSAPAGAQLASLLPTPGSAVTISPVFVPPTLKGLNIHPENPFLFDFIVGRGDDKIEGTALKAESEKLVKFFLTAMTIPDKEAWVNLSPYEANRIIPDALGKTEMGKVMLEQDYLLKQLASSLTNPDTDLGKKFWTDVRAKAKEKFGTTDIPMSTFNKVWIVPSKAEVAEKDGKVFITKNSLKVMLEEDYEAMSNQKDIAESRAPARDQAPSKTAVIANEVSPRGTNEVKQSLTNEIASSPVAPRNDVLKISSEVFRSTILPTIEKEINEGKNFAAVRQIYDAAILAVWYKSALKESLLGKIYADKSKVKGIETDAVGFKEEVYKKYVEAFKKGAYNIIKEDFDMSKDESTPRRYFSGGMSTAYPDGVAVSSGVTEVVVKFDHAVVRVVAAEELVEAKKHAEAAAPDPDAPAIGSSAVTGLQPQVRLNNSELVTAIAEGKVRVGTTFIYMLVNDGGSEYPYLSKTIKAINPASVGKEASIEFTDGLMELVPDIKNVTISAASAVSSLTEQAFLTLDAKMADIEQNGSGKTKEEIVNEILSMLTQEDNRDHSIEVFRALQLEVGNSYSKVEFLNDNLGSQNPNIGTLRTALSDTDVYETLVSIIRNDDNRLERFLNLKRVIDQVEEQWKDQDLPSGSVMYMVINTWLDSAELRNNLERVISSVNKSKFGLLKAILGQFNKDTQAQDLIGDFSHSDYRFYDYFRDYVKTVAKSFNKAIAQRATTRAANNLGRSMSESTSVSLSSEPLDVLTLVIKRWILNSGDDFQQILREAGEHYQAQKKRWEFVETLLDKIISGELSTTDSLEFFLIEGGVANDVLEYLLEIGDNELSSEESEAVKALMAEVRNVANSNDSRFLNEKIRGIIQIWQNPTNRQSLRLVLDKMVLESTQMATEFGKLSRIPVAAQTENQSKFLNVLISSGELYRSALMNFVAEKSSSSAVERREQAIGYALTALKYNLNGLRHLTDAVRIGQTAKILEDRIQPAAYFGENAANAAISNPLDELREFNFKLAQEFHVSPKLLEKARALVQESQGQASRPDVNVTTINAILDLSSTKLGKVLLVDMQEYRWDNLQFTILGRRFVELTTAGISPRDAMSMAFKSVKLNDKVDQWMARNFSAEINTFGRRGDTLNTLAPVVQALEPMPEQLWDAMLQALIPRVKGILDWNETYTLQKAFEVAVAGSPLTGLTKILADMRGNLKSDEKVVAEIANRYATNQRALDNVALTFLIPDSKTGIAPAKNPADAARMALASISEADQLFLVFAEDVKRLTTSGKSATEAIDTALKNAPINQARNDLQKALGDRVSKLSDAEILDAYSIISKAIGTRTLDGKVRELADIFLAVNGILENQPNMPILEAVQAVVEVPQSGQAALVASPDKKVGGINFDPTLMNLQVKRDKNGVPLPVFQQDLPNINIEGLYPVIINIAPATMANFPLLSKAEEQKQRIPSAKDDLSPLDRQKVARRQGV